MSVGVTLPTRDHSLHYLEFRLWIGLWVAFFGVVLVATEASHLVRYFTRFTEEGFCALISLIFIYDSLKKMLSLADTFPINWQYRLDNVTSYSCVCNLSSPGEPKQPLGWWEAGGGCMGLHWDPATQLDGRRCWRRWWLSPILAYWTTSAPSSTPLHAVCPPIPTSWHCPGTGQCSARSTESLDPDPVALGEGMPGAGGGHLVGGFALLALHCCF